MKTQRVILADLNRERYGSESTWFTREPDNQQPRVVEGIDFDDSDVTIARRRREALADLDHLNAKEA